VLVVDDTASFRGFLVRALNLFGYRTIEAASCAEIDGVLESTIPAAVVLDWHLGDDCAEVRLNDLQKLGVPVVVITGDPESLATIGAPVLGKPVHLESLRRVMAELVPV